MNVKEQHKKKYFKFTAAPNKNTQIMTVSKHRRPQRTCMVMFFLYSLVFSRR